MKCLVCVKYVPADGEVQMDASHSLVRCARTQQLNPADEAALEAALRLAGPCGVTVLCMGAAFCEAPLRELLGRGAQAAVLVSGKGFAGADSLATARTLAAAVRRLGPFDLVLAGRRTLDGETGQVPPELAALLGWPCLTNLVDAALADESGAKAARQEGAADALPAGRAPRLVCRRLLEDGIHTLTCETPAVISLCEYSYPLRLPSLAALRAAREKRVTVLDEAALGADPAQCGFAGSPTRVQSVTAHAAGRRHCAFAPDPAAGAAQLAQMLREVEP